MDGLEGVTLGVQPLVEGCSQVLHEGQAGRALDRGGGTWPGASRVGAGPIPADHVDARMRLSPQGPGLRLTIGQEGTRSRPLAITPDGPRGLTLPHGPVVDTEPGGGPHLGGADGATGARGGCD